MKDFWTPQQKKRTCIFPIKKGRFLKILAVKKEKRELWKSWLSNGFHNIL